MNHSVATYFRQRLRVLLLFSVFFTFPCFSQENVACAVFVNTSVPEKQYSSADLRAIFAMRKRYWSDGSEIHVFVLPDNDPLHQQLTKLKLNIFSHQLRKIWDRMIFSGTGKAPSELKSVAEMKQKISTTPGAIGYLETKNSYDGIRMLDYE